ncbi:midnolin homolog [Hyalella azteca]|uniref:Midnolin homolog n=1 Tax=Hyalella azteca TaxID=294128 RepID=A0A8B7NHX2_HYAAZ|nr:midnolin homolog [Hyalella azteca]
MSSCDPSNVLVSPSICVCGLPLSMLSVQVQATTGNIYNLRVAHSDTVDYIRRIIAKKTKLSKERILLLYKDRQLRDGSLEEHNVRDGAKLHLVPSVETGLLSQRPEQSVMQALESLNDGQVTDFLSGKAPLNLTMRLGDHMMLIQLQLSTVSPVQHHSSNRTNPHHLTTLRRGYSSSSSNSSITSSAYSNVSTNSSPDSLNSSTNSSSSSALSHIGNSIASSLPQPNSPLDAQSSLSTTTTSTPSTIDMPPPSSTTNSVPSQSLRNSSNRHHHHHYHHNHKNVSPNGVGAARHHHHHGHHYHHSHPYYHHPYPQYHLLSQPHSTNPSLQSSKHSTQAQPINLQQQQQQHKSFPTTNQNTYNSTGKCPSNNTNNNTVASACNASSPPHEPPCTPPRRSSSANYSPPSFSSPASSASSFSPTSPTAPWSPVLYSPPAPSPSVHSASYFSSNTSYRNGGGSSFTPTPYSNQQHQSNNSTSELPIRVCPHASVDDLDLSDLGLNASQVGEDLSFNSRRGGGAVTGSVGGRVRGVSAVGLDTRALAEASRNLTQTLRQLSSEVLTNKPSTAASSHHNHHHHAHHHNYAGAAAASLDHKKRASPAGPYVPGQKNNATVAGSSSSCDSTEPRVNIGPAIPSDVCVAPETVDVNSKSGTCPTPGAGTDVSLDSARRAQVAPKSTRSRACSSTRSVNSGKCARTQGWSGRPFNAPGVESSAGDGRRGSTCPPHQPQGAIIESMQHHGKGVFSGTFSGTLNPALQDRQGRPKRDISTIIHILNDLLCATPHYTSTAAAVAAVAAAAASTTRPSSSAPRASSAAPQTDAAANPKDTVSAEDAATRSRVQQIQAMLEQRAERRRARRLARTAGSGQPYSLPVPTASKPRQPVPGPVTLPEAPKESSKASEMNAPACGNKSSIDKLTALCSDSSNSVCVSKATVPDDVCLGSAQQHQHLMRELLKGCVSASNTPSHISSAQDQTCSFADSKIDCEPHENYSAAAHVQPQQQNIAHSPDVISNSVLADAPSAMEVDEPLDVASEPTKNSSVEVNPSLSATAELTASDSPSVEAHVKRPQEQRQQQSEQQQEVQQSQQQQQPQQEKQADQQQESTGDADQQDTAKIVSLNSGTVMA